MASFHKSSLLSDLHDRIELIQNSLLSFSMLTSQQFNYKTNETEWSIAEIFEHLNLSQGHYLRCIEKELMGASKITHSKYKSSWLGDFFYDKIMPRPNGTVLKMPAPAYLQAKSNNLDGPFVLQKFVNQLDEIQYVIEQAGQVDMEKIKVSLSFTSLIKLRLGDVLRFLVAHNERHLLQANRMLQKLPKEELVNYS